MATQELGIDIPFFLLAAVLFCYCHALFASSEASPTYLSLSATHPSIQYYVALHFNV
jgi:hypothetical protein